MTDASLAAASNMCALLGPQRQPAAVGGVHLLELVGGRPELAGHRLMTPLFGSKSFVAGRHRVMGRAAGLMKERPPRLRRRQGLLTVLSGGRARLGRAVVRRRPFPQLTGRYLETLATHANHRTSRCRRLPAARGCRCG